MREQDDVTIAFVVKANGPERLVCDAELIFNTGLLAGMKLVGFSVWQGAEGDMYVTFPSRAFGTASDRKFFDYLRSVHADTGGSLGPALKAAILEAYRETRQG